MIPVDTSPIAKLTTTTATSMMFIGLRNWPPATAQTDGGFSLAISLRPNLDSRLAASSELSPSVASVPSDAATSGTSRVYGGAASGSAANAVPPSARSVSTVQILPPTGPNRPPPDTRPSEEYYPDSSSIRDSGSPSSRRIGPVSRPSGGAPVPKPTGLRSKRAKRGHPVASPNSASTYRS